MSFARALRSSSTSLGEATKTLMVRGWDMGGGKYTPALSEAPPFLLHYGARRDRMRRTDAQEAEVKSLTRAEVIAAIASFTGIFVAAIVAHLLVLAGLPENIV